MLTRDLKNSLSAEFSEWVEAKTIDKLDLFSAELILKGALASPDCFLLASFLCAASRNGHLCIQLKESILPEVERIWTVDDPQKYNELLCLLKSGFKKLLNSQLDNAWIHREENRLYLMKNFKLESELYQAFLRRVEEKPELCVQEVECFEALTQEQQAAVSLSLNKGLSFIAGGPGVGKTFTASHLIELFLKKFPKALVCIGAPTGKAVANLQQKFENSVFVDRIEAQTLHRLFTKKVVSYLPYDLILVDESSMVDAPFFLKILKSAKPRSRIIFLGDPNQLPPIGVGTIFQELLEKSPTKATLTVCQRTDLKHILESADLVRSGKAEEYIKLFYPSTTKALPPYKELVSALLNNIPKISQRMSDFEVLESFQKYKILCANKLGEYGSEHLNTSIYNLLKDRFAHPIMISKNDYQLELFNGDLGFINSKGEGVFSARDSSQPFAVKNAAVRRIPQELLTHFEYAYCLSIHKSQGSEYEKISVILPPQSEVFGRELLYTAITRAKKEFELFSDIHTLTQLIRANSIKQSGLSSIRGTSEQNRS